MKVAVLSPIAWRTPPEKYGPWEQIASTITEGLVKKGIDVTLFASGNSITSGRLSSITDLPYGDNPESDAKVLECLHISHLMEMSNQYDIIHNHFDFLPLTYSRLIKTPMITTIHGFSSPRIIPVYEKYNAFTSYVSISDADRCPGLDYLATIYHGANPDDFTFKDTKENYLLYFGRIHPEKGTHAAIEIARKSGYPLIIAGLIQDENYYHSMVKPFIDGKSIRYVGNVGHKERNYLLGCAKALLHPIYFEEPFGLSVLEAMMCGTPVIAFSRGSMPELIVTGQTGFLVKTISEAIETVKKLDKIDPKNCRDHACRKFSVERMIDQYIASYKTVLDELN